MILSRKILGTILYPIIQQAFHQTPWTWGHNAQQVLCGQDDANLLMDRPDKLFNNKRIKRLNWQSSFGSIPRE